MDTGSVVGVGRWDRGCRVIACRLISSMTLPMWCVRDVGPAAMKELACSLSPTSCRLTLRVGASKCRGCRSIRWRLRGQRAVRLSFSSWVGCRVRRCLLWVVSSRVWSILWLCLVEVSPLRVSSPHGYHVVFLGGSFAHASCGVLSLFVGGPSSGVLSLM
ncbi:hypothetical protein BDZ89DRAFT_248541 [Hymenopellis radicata]|nr:hypothetical protein BDZ89DRAFT_248541 [Hymenopellis radicata]